MTDRQLKLGDYLLLEKIAQGGMAEVFKAKTSDPQGIERLVVIKRILPHISSNSEYIDMLIDEARIAVNFNHGNIAQIHDLGRVADDYFIVMEYVDGKTLGQIIRELKARGEPIPVEVAAYCVAEICRGLNYIHQKTDGDGKPLGVVHRDISPQNVIVSCSGTVKIIDFGVAKAEEKQNQTESGVLKGKFAYMSPEQAEGNPIDCRSDIFAAGILLWELLTQERLFKRKSNQETLRAVRKAKVLLPSKRRADVPHELDQIVLRALKGNRTRRYQQAISMADDLNRFLMDRFPHFRPIQLAEFLYRYFGPEADEVSLPPELPQWVFKPSPKFPSPIDEEKTELDSVSKFSPVIFFRRPAFLVATLGILLLGGGGALAFYLVSLSRGELILSVTPETASVLVNGKPATIQKGDARISGWVSDPVQVHVEQKGFITREVSFHLKGGKKESLKITLAREVPPFGDLFVSTEPSGALLYLDGSEWGQKSPSRIPHLSSEKKYKVGALLDGYEHADKQVTLSKGKTTEVHFDLKLKEAMLTILSSPEGADVIIDDQAVGKTPYTYRMLIPEESFLLRIELQGYESQSQEISLKAGDKKDVQFELRKTLLIK